MTIVIDPGHGGNDPGACGGTVKEKDLVLKQGLMLGHFLRALGYKTKLTRDKDIRVVLVTRQKSINEGDLFVSLHINGAVSKAAAGVSVWYHGDDSSGKELATYILDNLIDSGGFPRYGPGVIADTTRYKIGFYVLRYAQKRKAKAAVLVETGFISNKHDREILMNDKDRNLTAMAIAEGIHKYLQPRY